MERAKGQLLSSAGSSRGSRRRLLGLALAGVVVLILLTPGARRAPGVLLFLPDLVPDVSARPLTLVTRAPTRSTVAFTADGTLADDATDSAHGEAWDGVLFLPAGRGPHPGLVIALGVSPAGRDDPRVVSLGDGLARLGIAAFVPYSANLEGRSVTPEEIDFLVAAHQTLADNEQVDPERVGFFGFCVGASLSLLAAGDPRIAEDVATLGWFGGYHRLDRLVAAVTSESVVVDGQVVPWLPDPLAREVVQAQLLALLTEGEQAAVEAELAARAQVGGATRSGEPQPRLDLSPSASAVLGLLSAPDRKAAEALLAQLPPAARATMDTLSPATRATNVRAPVYLMSDTGDKLIPAGETDALAADLGERVARRTVFTVFSHVDLDDLEEPTRVARELGSLYAQVHAIVGSLRKTGR